MKRSFTSGRPEAPTNATLAEKQEWSAIVNAFPVGWFDETDLHTILELARARASSNHMAMNLETCELMVDAKVFMALRDRECRRAVFLMEKLRNRKQTDKTHDPLS